MTDLDGRKITFDSDGKPLAKIAVKIDKLPKQYNVLKIDLKKKMIKHE